MNASPLLALGLLALAPAARADQAPAKPPVNCAQQKGPTDTLYCDLPPKDRADFYTEMQKAQGDPKKAKTIFDVYLHSRSITQAQRDAINQQVKQQAASQSHPAPKASHLETVQSAAGMTEGKGIQDSGYDGSDAQKSDVDRSVVAGKKSSGGLMDKILFWRGKKKGLDQTDVPAAAPAKPKTPFKPTPSEMGALKMGTWFGLVGALLGGGAGLFLLGAVGALIGFAMNRAADGSGNTGPSGPEYGPPRLDQPPQDGNNNSPAS